MKKSHEALAKCRMKAKDFGNPYRVKNVAFGSGLAMIAISNIRAEREELKLRAPDKASITVSFVMFLPSCGRNL